MGCFLMRNLEARESAVTEIARLVLESSLKARELTLRDLYVAALKGMVR